MKKITFMLFAGVLLYSCDIDQKKELELPEVDVDVETEAGQLPTFDVDWAKIDVGTRTTTIEVPKVVIVMEEEEVEVPYIDVNMPDDSEKEEMTIAVEAEVIDKEHTIEIQEIIATDDNLYVISKLEEGDNDLGDQKLRVSDRIVLNAPDLNIKHIIVGERPDRVFNSQYRYVKNGDAFKKGLKNGKSIYTK